MPYPTHTINLEPELGTLRKSARGADSPKLGEREGAGDTEEGGEASAGNCNDGKRKKLR